MPQKALHSNLSARDGCLGSILEGEGEWQVDRYHVCTCCMQTYSIVEETCWPGDVMSAMYRRCTEDIHKHNIHYHWVKILPARRE